MVDSEGNGNPETERGLEEHAHDTLYGGYGEIYNRDWSPVTDSSINEIGDAAKTMNTSLHIIEALTNLYRV